MSAQSLTLQFAEGMLPASVRWAEPVSDEQLLTLSGLNHSLRLERTREGEITVMSPVGGTGGLNESWVNWALIDWSLKTGNGVAFNSNVGFTLPDGSCLSPDAAWIDRARWNAMSRQQQDSYPPLCPDFIIEVRSRTDTRAEIGRKMERWMENGARLAWLVDPLAGEVVIYRAGEATETLERPDVVVGHAPVEGFQLRATQLWTDRPDHA